MAESDDLNLAPLQRRADLWLRTRRVVLSGARPVTGGLGLERDVARRSHLLAGLVRRGARHERERFCAPVRALGRQGLTEQTQVVVCTCSRLVLQRCSAR